MLFAQKLVAVVILVASISVPAFAASFGAGNDVRQSPDVRAIAQLLNLSSRTNLATAKLTFDKIIDPSIDVPGALRRIDAMAAKIAAVAGPGASPIQKLAAVRRFIYVAGAWNGYRPFQYDLTDPLGSKIENKLLTTYLATRRGNCMSMPVLFLILADKVGLTVTASTAPDHVFVKFTDADTGKTYNIEATSGGLPARDAWYREQLTMSDDAVRNGAYLKTLSRHETVAVLADVDLEYFMASGRYRDAIATADLILGAYPQFIPALLAKGTAYASLIDRELKPKYSAPRDMPPDALETYRSYLAQNELAFETAERFGWREMDGRQQRPAN